MYKQVGCNSHKQEEKKNSGRKKKNKIKTQPSPEKRIAIFSQKEMLLESWRCNSHFKNEVLNKAIIHCPMTSIQLDVSEIMHCLFCGTKKWTSFPKKWGIPFRHGKRNLLLYLHRSYTKRLETQNLEVILSACMKRKFGKHSTTGRFFYIYEE